MKTAIVYSADTGEIIMNTSVGDNIFSALVAVSEVPDGYYVESMDTATGTPVLKEIPKTEEQKRMDEIEAQLAALKKSSEAKDDALSEQQDFQEDCIAEMASIVYADETAE